jgi:hypothetical protein
MNKTKGNFNKHKLLDSNYNDEYDDETKIENHIAYRNSFYGKDKS